MRIHLSVTALLAFAASAVLQAAEDPRQRIELPAPMQVHMLANMRDHLAAIETITRLLAEGRYGTAADTAEARLGMSAMQAHGAAHMAPFMPEPMRAIGTAMHRAASRLALSVRDAEVTGEPAAVLLGLSEVMSQCVACHAGYRVH
jgi:antitoxin component HigA of HigAB toxin-antitoxin module